MLAGVNLKSVTMQARKPLTNLQVELLELFQQELSEEQLLEIKALLVKYFADKVDEGMDALFEANQWGEEKIEAWSKEHR